MKATNVELGAGSGGGEDAGWITAREAARQLGIAPRRLYDLVDCGTLTAHQVGDDLKLRPDDVAAYHDDSRP